MTTKTNGEKFKALGCHIYAGGHTLGVLKAGFQVLAHLEEWKFGTKTVEKNLGIACRVGREAWNEKEFAGKVDWLYGNPPCASWSAAGIKVKDKETRNVERYTHDDRTKCTELLFSLIPIVKPTVFSWECVAMATVNGSKFVRSRVEFVQSLGYDVHGLLFDGADLGLPQHRKRFFFVASKVRFEPFAPDGKRTTVRDAWKGLRNPGPILKTRPDLVTMLKKMPKGELGVLHKYFMDAAGTRALKKDAKTGYVKGRPGFLHMRVPLDGLSPTVTGGQHLYHPSEPRALTILEQQLLCGYPRDYEFVGAPSSQYAQIAKAVLPPAGNWLARNVRKALEANEKVGRKRVATLHNFITEGRKFCETWDATEKEAA